jgi:hypothetical protein
MRRPGWSPAAGTGLSERSPVAVGELGVPQRHGASQVGQVVADLALAKVGVQHAEHEGDDQQVEHQVGAATDADLVGNPRCIVRPQHRVDVHHDEREERDPLARADVDAVRPAYEVDQSAECREDQNDLHDHGTLTSGRARPGRTGY